MTQVDDRNSRAVNRAAKHARMDDMLDVMVEIWQTQASNMVFLPIELIENILCRLPVKTLKRFRAVAKWWRDLIDSEQFVKSHLRQSLISNSHRNLIITRRITGRRPYLNDLDLLEKNVMFETPFRYSSSYGISNCCNGIVLVGSEPPTLWNPFTRDYKVLPKLPVDYPNVGSHCYIAYHFAYDSRNDDYKVVCIVTWERINEAWIYGLKLNCWRRIEAFPYSNRNSTKHDYLHVNGSLHTRLVDHYEGSKIAKIMAFSVESEEHYEVVIPPEIQMSGCLCVFDQCLSLVISNFGGFDVWVMEEYGVVESWTKLFSVPFMKYGSVIPIAYSRERDKILLCCESRGRKFVWYDLSEGIFESVALTGCSQTWRYPTTCVQTLISLRE